MVELDGAYGEGGGQILRSALTLSLITGRPFFIRNIRARRERPGLRPQHLAAVRAAAQVGRAVARGDEIGSRELYFEPRGVWPGRYRFAVGTAGASTLVFQTVFPALALRGGEPSELWLEGGTHVPLSPSLDYLTGVYLPWARRLGLDFEARVERLGFYPRGGGRWWARVAPASGVRGLSAPGPFRLEEARVVGAASGLPAHVARRIARAAAGVLEEAGIAPRVETGRPAAGGPGAYGFVLLAGEPGPAGFTALGAPGRPSERVGREAGRLALEFLRSRSAVEVHLADQLLLLLALAREPSRVLVAGVSGHLRTQAWLVSLFLPVRVEISGRVVAVAPKVDKPDRGF